MPRSDPISPELALVCPELRRQALLELESAADPPSIAASPQMMSALTLNHRIASAEHHESALRPVILPEYGPAAPRRRGPLSMIGAAAIYALVSLLRTLVVLALILIILSVVIGLAVAAAT